MVSSDVVLITNYDKALDAVADILVGAEDMDGRFYPGPLSDVPIGAASAIIDSVVEACAKAFGYYAQKGP